MKDKTLACNHCLLEQHLAFAVYSLNYETKVNQPPFILSVTSCKDKTVATTACEEEL